MRISLDEGRLVMLWIMCSAIDEVNFQRLRMNRELLEICKML